MGSSVRYGIMRDKKFLIKEAIISFLIGFVYAYLVLQKFILWKILLFAFIFAIMNTIFMFDRNKNK